ncbi:PIG-L family deacetylase [Roseibium sp.]|uniref:PIG-L deacetylase family protein n=1 Tax=Roseibium sp. TaxID=1936156 RepID=UPI0032650B36
MSRNVLVVAAHPDDEALGCGGTMARHASDGDNVHVVFLTNGVSARNPDTPDRDAEDHRHHAAEAALKTLGVRSSVYGDFPDNQLDTVALLRVAQFIEKVAQDIRPEIVYTHHAGDLNVDHRICHEAVLTAFRPAPGQTVKAIYAFEVCSSTEWRFSSQSVFFPTRYCDITGHLDTKQKALEEYAEEMRAFPHMRSAEVIAALARFRGATVGVEAAEAFTVIREVC